MTTTTALPSSHPLGQTSGYAAVTLRAPDLWTDAPALHPVTVKFYGPCVHFPRGGVIAERGAYLLSQAHLDFVACTARAGTRPLLERVTTKCYVDVNEWLDGLRGTLSSQARTGNSIGLSAYPVERHHHRQYEGTPLFPWHRSLRGTSFVVDDAAGTFTYAVDAPEGTFDLRGPLPPETVEYLKKGR